ncbi:hypothetical protein [Demequina globuliformis]|uniref:hypothetical protein n=1 Tax=Demequina globuliformis TaxID=676202 RepID=UPI0007831A8B|nr:hypothetical protein [Demequina globuliformis]
MSMTDHEGTEALKRLADEVEAERRAKDHTPFDAQGESEDDPVHAADADHDRTSDNPDRPKDGGAGMVPPAVLGQ